MAKSKQDKLAASSPVQTQSSMQIRPGHPKICTAYFLEGGCRKKPCGYSHDWESFGDARESQEGIQRIKEEMRKILTGDGDANVSWSVIRSLTDLAAHGPPLLPWEEIMEAEPVVDASKGLSFHFENIMEPRIRKLIQNHLESNRSFQSSGSTHNLDFGPGALGLANELAAAIRKERYMDLCGDDILEILSYEA